ncbi:hypothetical protein FN846DRAFT_952026 [Sphaerosporella brunnea]|uniref:HAUS augmin-like complex subunit 4-domain-containing protein n=1 Tax=Sphaerosporella brunnea TaxID=1250544 RepID=A0A5J5EVX7_9PEZI|nr:hypothetical protein FN846DRAFT_952026 [Sphaerosporella brunnea]
MLPPIPPGVLDANPRFANLYAELTTRLLDPLDASTRSLSRPNDVVDQELRTHRAELAKTWLLQSELTNLTSRSSTLSEELQEALDLLLSSYYRSLPPDEQALLQEEFEDLEDNLPLIGHHVSTSLHKSALEICRIAYPGEQSPRVLSQKLDSLPAETALRLVTLQKSRAALSQKQLALTALCCEILREYRTTTQQLLSLLTTASTAVPKALTAKTEHLSLVAESMALKLSVLRHQALSAIYDPEALNALENYRMHLRDTSTRLVARQRVVEEELRKYRSAGSDMKTLVERYGQIMRSMETVNKDIKRLTGQV